MSTLVFIEINTQLCTGCGICADQCPFEAIVVRNERAEVLDTCSGCLCCLDSCPEGALAEKAASSRAQVPENNRYSGDQLPLKHRL